MNSRCLKNHLSKIKWFSRVFQEPWCFADVWGRVLWVNSMKGMSSTQLSCWKLQKILRYCSSSWLTLSVSPLVCRWYAVLREDLTFNFFHNSWITLDANWGPQSEIICLGSPVLRQTLSRINWVVSSAVMVLLHGVIIVALLKQSTTTRMLSKLFNAGRLMMKSMVMFCHMLLGTWFSCKGMVVWGSFLVVWHRAHPST